MWSDFQPTTLDALKMVVEDFDHNFDPEKARSMQWQGILGSGLSTVWSPHCGPGRQRALNPKKEGNVGINSKPPTM